jgi:hypothetical protein
MLGLEGGQRSPRARILAWLALASFERSRSTWIGSLSTTRRMSVRSIRTREKPGWLGRSSRSTYDCAVPRTRRVRVASLMALRPARLTIDVGAPAEAVGSGARLVKPFRGV